MPVYRTATDEQRATIATGTTSPIRQNTLVSVEEWPEAGKAPVYVLDVCADGVRPDGCAVKTTDLAPSYGAVVLFGARMPGPLGTSVAADDPLIVKSGKFSKAVKGDKFFFRAMQDGVMGDVINTYPSEGVVP